MVTNEYERIWKEAIMAKSRYYYNILLDQENHKIPWVKIAGVPAKHLLNTTYNITATPTNSVYTMLARPEVSKYSGILI
jgi:hypothetical protein